VAAEAMEAEGMEVVVDFTGVVEASIVEASMVEVSMAEVSAPELMADTAIPMDTAATLTAMEDATWFGDE
jgi:hypothetical protein